MRRPRLPCEVVLPINHLPSTYPLSSVALANPPPLLARLLFTFPTHQWTFISSCCVSRSQFTFSLSLSLHSKSFFLHSSSQQLLVAPRSSSVVSPQRPGVRNGLRFATRASHCDCEKSLFCWTILLFSSPSSFPFPLCRHPITCAVTTRQRRSPAFSAPRFAHRELRGSLERTENMD